MTDSLRVLSDPLGGSALSRQAQLGRAPVAWYPPRPSSAEQWKERAEAVRSSVGAGWLDGLRDAIAVGAGTAASERLAAAAARGVVITTGQQPGLFGGAAYTWSKALSALALADVLESELGIPVAPVFWAATDDSDLAEASWTMVSGANGAERLTMTATAADGTMMKHVPLPDVSVALERLTSAGGSVADPRPLALARAAYSRRTTVGAAYVELLRGILEPLGIAVLDAAHPSVSAAAHPILQRALLERERVRQALAGRGAEIRAAGFDPQVHEVDDLTLVFERRDGRRERVPMARGAVAAAALPAGTLSPNVLLRPVAERAILPTIAYVAGPAELAYFAQVSAVAASLGAAAPLGVPRWSGTVIESRVQAVLDRHGLTIDAFADPHAVETRLARAAWPEPLSQALASLRDALAGGLRHVRESLPGNDLLNPAAVEGAARAMAWRVSRLERRITASVKRRDEAWLRDVRMARGALYPEGVRQERALNLLPLMARHGPTLVESMRAAATTHARSLVGAAEASGVNR